LAELFDRHPVVGLDSNVLIHLFEGHGPSADAAEALVDGIEGGRATGVLASVALTEVPTRPASLGDGAHFERFADELRSIPNLRIVALAAKTAIDAAWGRSAGRDLGDAIHIATARSAGATCFVTNDRRVRGRAGVEIVLLADLTDQGSGVTAPASSGPQEGQHPNARLDAPSSRELSRGRRRASGDDREAPS
jgi:predicted nucleic acid-binding protein